MARVDFGWTLVVAALLISVSGIANARSIKEYGLAEKVSASDAIFIGNVVSLRSPEPRINGVGEYAVVKVEKVLKGDDVGHERKFVVKGFSAELNPDCCQVGKTYLFFAKDGYDVFVMGEGEISKARVDEGEFSSAANGAFSTYLISDDRIIGWGESSDSPDGSDMPREEAIGVLCRLINGQK